MLSESLRGVIAQTLCRKIGGGRVAALEVLIATQAVSNLIREGKTFQIPSMMQVGKAVGMVTPQRRAAGAGHQEARRARRSAGQGGRQGGIRVGAEAHHRGCRPAGPARRVTIGSYRFE